MQFDRLRRRDFITLLGGATAAWPLAARAEQPERVRRIGFLTNFAADDPGVTVRMTAFVQGLQELGWIDGRNIRIDIRYGGGDADRARRCAEELVALAPDVMLASGGSALAAVKNAARMPIVFVNVTDPVGAGHVASLSRPGGNITGFTLFEYDTSGKWLELLKEIAPGVTRSAVIHDPSITSGTGQLAAIQAVAPSVGVELTPVSLRDASGIERSIATFARSSNAGLIVTISPSALRHRELIIALAARHRLPAVYAWRIFVDDGGLISYGPDDIEQHRRAAGYVDRILKGEKPADLPVQAPTRFETVLNLKTAKALDLDVPASVLVRANAVIE
jgi:putative tryptophan/tyrosine transport system substrate-binding protein